MADETPSAWPGDSYPLGASYDGTGTNFALFCDAIGEQGPRGERIRDDSFLVMRLMMTSGSIQLLRRA